MRRILLSLIAGLLAVGAAAGDAAAQEEYVSEVILCNVLEHEKRVDTEGRRHRVVIDRGREHAVTAGCEGYLTLGDEHAGIAVTVDAGRTHATVELVLPKAMDSIPVGEKVWLTVSVPKLQRSILWELATVHAEFRGRKYDEGYYTLAMLMPGISEQQVGDIFREMVSQIRETGRAFAAEIPGGARTKGRYRGRTTAEVMESATVADLQAFLEFVLDYPGKYHKRLWQIDETFATWVLNEAPEGPREITRVLRAAADPAVRRGILESRQPELVKRGVAAHILGRAKQQRGWGAPVAVQLELATIAIETAEVEGVADVGLRARQFRAEVLSSVRRNEEAGRDWNAVFEARLQGDGLRGGAQLVELGALLSRYGESALAARAFDRAKAVFPEGKLLRLYALLLRREGNSLLTAGAHAAASAVLQRAIAAYEGTEDTEGRWKSCLLLGHALADGGDLQQAVKWYTRVREEAKAAGNREYEARGWARTGLRQYVADDYAGALVSYGNALEIRRAMGAPAEVAAMLMAVARVYRRRGNCQKALDLVREVLEMRGAASPTAGIAECREELGRLLKLMGDTAGALREFRSAMQTYQDLNRWGAAAARLNDIAQLHEARREYAQALQAYESAAGVARSVADRGLEADVRESRALLHLRLGDTPSAIDDCNRAIVLARRAGDAGQTATVQLHLAECYARQREFSVARALTAESLRSATSRRNRWQEANARSVMGRICSTEYRAEEAGKWYLEALELYRAMDAPEQVAGTLASYAAALDLNGRFEAALTAYQESYDVAAASKLRSLMFNALNGAADVARSLGRFEASEQAMRRALKIAEETGDPMRLALVQHSLGQLLSAKGELARAIEAQDAALELYRKLNNDWGVAAILNNRAGDFILSGDPERALRDLVTAFRIGLKTGDPMLETGLRATRAEALEALGRRREALAELRGAVATARRIDNRRMISGQLRAMARILTDLGDLDDAGAALEEALGLAQRIKAVVSEAGAHEGIARLRLAAGELEAAAAAAGAGRARLEGVDAPHTAWKLAFVLSRIHERAGRLAAAEQARREAIGVLDRLLGGVGGEAGARERFLASKLEVYESMADLLGRLSDGEADPQKRQAYLDEALQFAARAHHELLQGTVRGGGTKEAQAAIQEHARRLRSVAQLERQLAAAQAAGNSARQEGLTKELARSRSELTRALRTALSEDADFKARMQFRPVAVDRQAGALPDNGRIVIYLTTPESLMIWVYSKQGVVTWKRRPVTRETLDELVGSFRDLMKEVQLRLGEGSGRGFGPAAVADESNPEWYRTNVTRVMRVSRALYDELLQPVAQEISGADPLVIVPYGALSYLPFEALMDAEQRFAGHKRRIAYSLSTSHLQTDLDRLEEPLPEQPGGWEAFIDPVGKLTDAVAEGLKIRALFDKPIVHSRSTGTATEAQVARLAKRTTILHIATHGYLNAGSARESYLELAPAEGSDGQLRYDEVLDALDPAGGDGPKNLRLVVLSACDSAVGLKTPEAQVMGLPDAFHTAGTHSVVASQWPVYTYSTTFLMEEFYKRLAAGADTAGALRDARGVLLEGASKGRYAHPYFWSPFLLYGDWR